MTFLKKKKKKKKKSSRSFRPAGATAGVLCRAASDRVLELRWTAAHPAPLPTEGIG